MIDSPAAIAVGSRRRRPIAPPGRGLEDELLCRRDRRCHPRTRPQRMPSASTASQRTRWCVPPERSQRSPPCPAAADPAHRQRRLPAEPPSRHPTRVRNATPGRPARPLLVELREVTQLRGDQYAAGAVEGSSSRAEADQQALEKCGLAPGSNRQDLFLDGLPGVAG